MPGSYIEAPSGEPLKGWTKWFGQKKPGWRFFLAAIFVCV